MLAYNLFGGHLSVNNGCCSSFNEYNQLKGFSSFVS